MLELNAKRVEIGSFPDGTMLIKQDIPKDFNTNRDAFITWHYENDAETLALVYLTGHLRSHGVTRIHLYMPYIPNARQDRVKSDEDVFTLKYFAGLINYLDFTSVTVLDPHSTVSEALFDNIVIKTPKDNIAKVISEIGEDNLMMFYPDEGAMKRYSTMSDRPYVFGIKKRDWTTGSILGLDVAGAVDMIAGSRFLIVDDICSRGGTFYHSAMKLKELGASEIYLYISHCENSILSGEVLNCGLIDRVFTTDSIFTAQHKKITVIK